MGHVVEAIKKIEEEGQGVSDEVKAEILKNEKHASTILEETGHNFNSNELTTRREYRMKLFLFLSQFSTQKNLLVNLSKI